MNITELTVHELQEKLKSKEITVTQITQAYVDRIKEKEKDVNAFITTLTDEALNKAKNVQEQIDRGEIKGDFAGIPIGIKDNICTKGIKTTCASRMLENFISPYDATIIEKLNQENIINLESFNALKEVQQALEKQNEERNKMLQSISNPVKDIKIPTIADIMKTEK